MPSIADGHYYAVYVSRYSTFTQIIQLEPFILDNGGTITSPAGSKKIFAILPGRLSNHVRRRPIVAEVIEIEVVTEAD